MMLFGAPRPRARARPRPPAYARARSPPARPPAHGRSPPAGRARVPPANLATWHSFASELARPQPFGKIGWYNVMHELSSVVRRAILGSRFPFLKF